MTIPQSTRVLLVEDEEITREWTEAVLIQHGFETLAVDDAASAIAGCARFQPHVALLDLMLPDAEGFELTRAVTADGNCGVIIVSGLSEREQRLDGLRSGADDYLTKPCDPDELVLKVEQLARRIKAARAVHASCSANDWRLGPWRIDLATQICRHEDGHDESLTDKEAKLLRVFLLAAGRVMARDELLEALSDEQDKATGRAVDTCVSRLRKKLEAKPARPVWLQSIYGAGYRLCGSVERLGD